MNQQTEQVELTAEKRSVLGKQVRQLRRQGWVPAVMYGHDFVSMPLQFEAGNLTRVLSQVGGSQLIRIKVKGQKQPEMALVRDVQRDCIRGTLMHVDFYRVMMTERLTAEVPLSITGESPVMERKEGILLHGISTIEVECLPGDLVDAIEVDLSDLVEIDQALYVRDLAVPAGIEVLTSLEEMIVRVAPLEAEEEEEEEEILPEAEEVEVITEAQETTGEED
ncbi:MAG: 50S ribosomal protein L25 [Chloroflexota bacterium]|nr:50S ribosomal protein L25 [Chloroflexota bacterium]